MEEREDNGQSAPRQTGRQRGCMFCRIEVDVTDVSMLKEGDHIVTRGQMSCLGYCYDHHAIVKTIRNVTNGENIAEIVVLGVHGKGGKEETYQRNEQEEVTRVSTVITSIGEQTVERAGNSSAIAHINEQAKEEICKSSGVAHIEGHIEEVAHHSGGNTQLDGQTAGTYQSRENTQVDGHTQEETAKSSGIDGNDRQTGDGTDKPRVTSEVYTQTREGKGNSSGTNENHEQIDEITGDSSGTNDDVEQTEGGTIATRASNGKNIRGKSASMFTFVVRYLCCCLSCVTVDRGYKVEPTTLYIKTDNRYGILGEYLTSEPLQIKKIVYNKPRNDSATVVEIASRLEEETVNGPGIHEYNLLLLNCEHFTNACVNGQEDMSLQEIKIQSSSLQSQLCWWRILHILFWSVQAFFYFVNFNVFAAFISKDDNIDLMHMMNSSFLENICVNHNNSLPGFNTHCDWFVVILLVIALILVSLLTSWKYYQPLYKYGFICSKCLGISRVDYLSRLFTTVFIEVIAIYLENPLYKFSSGLNAGMTRTYLIVAGVSITAAYVVYSLSNLLTFLLGLYCYPNLNRRCELRQYFPFRGVPWLCLSFVKILKHFCRRNVLFRKGNSISPNTRIDFLGSVNVTE